MMANLGLPGVEQALSTGLVFGAIFAVTGRIWMVMCAHAAFDLTAVAIIYWNLEAAAAHLVTTHSNPPIVSRLRCMSGAALDLNVDSR